MSKDIYDEFRNNSTIIPETDDSPIKMENRILIVCEGQRTEPAYFSKFVIPEVDIVTRGVGGNTLFVVERAIKMKNAAIEQGRSFQQIWCVCDRDEFPRRDFNAAQFLAKKNGINFVYSVESFELWYLLHFNFCDAALTRHDYCKLLSKSMGRRYKKNCNNMYETLKPLQETAIRNAEKLLTMHSDMNRAMYDSNPSTTVHTLVQELNRQKELATILAEDATNRQAI